MKVQQAGVFEIGLYVQSGKNAAYSSRSFCAAPRMCIAKPKPATAQHLILAEP
jgi:hypothetical protein